MFASSLLYSAQVTWGVQQIGKLGDTTSVGSTIYLIDATASVSLSDMSTALASTGLSALDDAKIQLTASSEAYPNGALPGVSYGGGTFNVADGATGNAKTYSYYAVVVSSDQKNFMISSTTAGKVLEGSTNFSATFSMASLPWQSVGGGGDVPEPTSGLLLLVGGALLALRRKQK